MATTKRVIDAQKGDVVLVGHSYGGAVITGAATGNYKIKALVYVAAFAPDAGEAVGGLIEKYSAPPLGTALVPDAAGFLTIDRAKFREVFAHDVPESETAIMAATQKPMTASAFGEPSGTPAWKTIPSWYVVAKEDRAINPELERFMAKRIGATTTELESSHVPFISKPEEVVNVIETASLESTKSDAL